MFLKYHRFSQLLSFKEIENVESGSGGACLSLRRKMGEVWDQTGVHSKSPFLAEQQNKYVEVMINY